MTFFRFVSASLAALAASFTDSSGTGSDTLFRPVGCPRLAFHTFSACRSAHFRSSSLRASSSLISLNG